MERRVARFLQGLRTPMSGASASYKGDVTVDFVNNPGKYIIECKLSDATSASGYPQIVLQLKWFAKLQQEASAMRAKFGILIIHYHGLKEDYVFIRRDHVEWLLTRSIRGDTLSSLLSADLFVKDIMRFENGKRRTIFGLEQRRITEVMTDFDGFKVMAVNTPDGTYYVFELKQFRDLMEGV